MTISDDEFLKQTDSLLRERTKSFSKQDLARKASVELVLSQSAAATVATREALRERDRIIRDLSARVEALEEGGICYRGSYQRAVPYQKGDTVTHAGSLWVALKSVAEGITPGSDPAMWQLASKGSKPVPAKERRP